MLSVPYPFLSTLLHLGVKADGEHRHWPGCANQKNIINVNCTFK